MTSLMSVEERKALSLPYTIKTDGRRQYSRCYMYDVNYTSILEGWLQRGFTTLDDGTRVPPTPISSSDWPQTKCLHGWIYDKRDYDSTLVTEVINPIKSLLFYSNLKETKLVVCLILLF